ncbi:MAG TPA: hypothetical protein VEA38_11970, partial [Terriglobales bacterium]|nr:hypothetical protein [Terriglobales bacterium]
SSRRRAGRTLAPRSNGLLSPLREGVTLDGQEEGGEEEGEGQVRARFVERDCRSRKGGDISMAKKKAAKKKKK